MYAPSPADDPSAKLSSNETTVALDRLIQASMVKFCNWRLAGFPMSNRSRCVPSNTKACPTAPEPYVFIPPNPAHVPLLPPTTSLPLPSPGHHATTPVGGVAQLATVGAHLPALPAA